MLSHNLKTHLALLLCCCLLSGVLFAQTPHALVPGLQIDSLFRTQANPNRLALDPVSGHILYCLPGGDVYEVTLPGAQAASEIRIATIADHGIADPQGMCFVDSVLFLSGNTNDTPGWTTARISRGKLQPNGSRLWTTVVQTEPHPGSAHPFTSVVANRAGTHLYWASGARTMTGNIYSAGGLHPGRRETPLNSRLYKLPILSQNLALPNDSAALDSSGYVYCWGLRNAYSMAFNTQDHLIAIDNSGERDDPEELNWLQQGRHYGFPWRMGDHWNQLINPNYDVNQDPLVNHLCGGYIDHIFDADSTFPNPPNVIFADPIRNLGPDADYYRDSLSGEVRDASADGHVMRSFTAHRSPLGLTIDRYSLLQGSFRGKSFLLSYMPGGDSTGMSPVSPWGSPGPFVDPAQDLLQLDLSYDTGVGEYVMQSHRIIDGFYLPVDAVLDGDKMYVIEQRRGTLQNLWRVTFSNPTAAGEPSTTPSYGLQAAPNPTGGKLTISLAAQSADRVACAVFDLSGRHVLDLGEWAVWPGANAREVDLGDLASGMYVLRVDGKAGSGWLRVVRD